MSKVNPSASAEEPAVTGRGAPGAGAKATAASAPAALLVGGKAYVGGVTELGRMLGGFTREVVAEAGQHMRATLQAKNLRDMGELQASWAQHRIETSASHAKEFADVVLARSRDVIAPIAALLKRGDAAA
ncbi:MAG TPA: phasin family protein [Rhodopila sp.]|nr:phasin family protein [Rhodopila sp.]